MKEKRVINNEKNVINKKSIKLYARFDGITSWEAIKEFGATRLSAIIFNLRKKGFIIENEWIETKNRYGDNVRFVKYSLNKESTFRFNEKLESSIND